MSLVFLLQSTALLLLALLLCRRCAEPARRAAIGFAAIAALPLLALVQLADLGWHPLTRQISVDTSAPMAPAWMLSPWTMLWIGYALVTVWQLLRWARAQWRVRRWLREARPCHAEAWQRQSRAMAGRTRIVVRVHDSAGSPFLLGLRHPCVIIPAYLEHCSEARARLVLLHELAHWQARDPQRMLLVDLICCFLWFQPLLQRVRRGFSADIELACDDRVLRAGTDAHDYAETIALCAAQQRLQGAALVGMAMQRSQLVQRVSRILAPPEASLHASLRWPVLLMGSAALLMLGINFSPRVEVIATASALAQAATPAVGMPVDVPLPAIPPVTSPQRVADAAVPPTVSPARTSPARTGIRPSPAKPAAAPPATAAATSEARIDFAQLRQSMTHVVGQDAQRYAQEHAGEPLREGATVRERLEQGMAQSRAERSERNKKVVRRVMEGLMGTIPLN